MTPGALSRAGWRPEEAVGSQLVELVKMVSKLSSTIIVTIMCSTIIVTIMVKLLSKMVHDVG